PSTTDIYTISLHDALPILSHVLHVGRRTYRTGSTWLRDRSSGHAQSALNFPVEIKSQFIVTHFFRSVYSCCQSRRKLTLTPAILDRKSTRLNSSHVKISYA